MGAIAVVDYGMGNLRSVAKALERVADRQQTVRITQSAADIASAERVVFPGVGALRDCVQEMDRLGLREPLWAAAQHKPFLGICLGMQALLEESEENGGTAGLGWIAGVVSRLPVARAADGQRLKVPHMGWNTVRQTVAHPLWEGIAQEEYFYFVHSYHVQPDDPVWVTGSTDYGGAFVSAIGRDAVFAVQFHPEKSQAAGLRLLHNFCRWNP